MPAASASAPRYCQGPLADGAYVAADQTVSCRTAIRVSHAMQADRCRGGRRCWYGAFYCWSTNRTFRYGHHGVCNDGHHRRIVFDWG